MSKFSSLFYLVLNYYVYLLRLWKASPIIAQMPGIHLNKALESKTIKFIRWKVHNDWVEQIRIEQRLNQVISCSNDENNALVIGCIIASTDIDSHMLNQNANGTVTSTTTVPSTLNGAAAGASNTTNTIGASSSSQVAPITTTSQSNMSVVSQNADYVTVAPASAILNTSAVNGNNRASSELNNLNISNHSTVTLGNNNNANTSAQDISAPVSRAKQHHQNQQSTTALIQSANMITSASSITVKRRPDNNETIFKVYKGVKTFDFSMEKNLLITGGKWCIRLEIVNDL